MIPIKAYLLAEDPKHKRHRVYRFEIKKELVSVGSNPHLNEVRIKDPVVAPRHFEIIYTGGNFFLRRIADSPVILDGQMMESPSEELLSGSVIEVGEFRFCFVMESSRLEVVLLLSIWRHDPGAVVPYSVQLVGATKFKVGKEGDVQILDKSLQSGYLEVESFGPNAVLVKSSKEVQGVYLDDQLLTHPARLIPGDRIVLSDQTIMIDFLAPTILEVPETLIAEMELSRYRLRPIDLRR